MLTSRLLRRCWPGLLLTLGACGQPASPPPPAPNIEQKTQARVESAIESNTAALDQAIEAQSAGQEAPGTPPKD